jgi:hypothetical protein
MPRDRRSDSPRGGVWIVGCYRRGPTAAANPRRDAPSSRMRDEVWEGPTVCRHTVQRSPLGLLSSAHFSRAERAPSITPNLVRALRTRRLRSHRRSAMTQRWKGLPSIEPPTPPFGHVPDHPHDDHQDEGGADQPQEPLRGVGVELRRGSRFHHRALKHFACQRDSAASSGPYGGRATLCSSLAWAGGRS